MTAPDTAAVRARAAEVLAEHTWMAWSEDAGMWRCEDCGLGVPGINGSADALAKHQADVLAAEGLLADPDALDAARAEVERLRGARDHLREDDALNRDAYLLVEAERDEARAALAALRERIEGLRRAWSDTAQNDPMYQGVARAVIAAFQDDLAALAAAPSGAEEGRA